MVRSSNTNSRCTFDLSNKSKHANDHVILYLGTWALGRMALKSVEPIPLEAQLDDRAHGRRESRDLSPTPRTILLAN